VLEKSRHASIAVQQEPEFRLLGAILA